MIDGYTWMLIGKASFSVVLLVLWLIGHATSREMGSEFTGAALALMTSAIIGALAYWTWM